MIMTTDLSTQTNKHKHNTTYGVVYPCPGLRQTQQCGEAKPVKLIQNNVIIMTIKHVIVCLTIKQQSKKSLKITKG